jgi:hypothetical protein
MAAKAIENTLGGVNGKTRGFFVVEGAESPVVLTLSGEVNPGRNHINDVCALEDRIDGGLGYLQLLRDS